MPPRLKQPPGVRAPRKSAPSQSHPYEPESDDDPSQAESGDDMDNATGRVEHLGSDLPDVANGPSRQLLQEAAARSPSASRSPSNQRWDHGTRETALPAPKPSPSKSVRFSMAAAPSPEARVSTGKLKRPSMNGGAQPPQSSLKRKTTNDKGEQESAAKRVRQSLPGADDNVRQPASIRPFRDDDWDILGEGPEKMPTTVGRSPRKAHRATAQEREEDEEQRQPTVRQSLWDMHQFAEPEAEAAPSEQQQPADIQELDEDNDEDDILPSPGALAKVHIKPNEPDKVARETSKRPMTSKQAKATSALRAHHQQRQLGGNKRNIFLADGERQEGFEHEDIGAAANGRKLKPKERRPKEPQAARKPAVDAGESSKAQKRRRKPQGQRDDDTVDELFEPERATAAREDDLEKDAEAGAEEILDDSSAEQSDDTRATDRRRFLGQYHLLKGIQKVVRKRRYNRAPLVKRLKAYRILCNEIIEKFDAMEGASNDRDRDRCEDFLKQKVGELQRRTAALDPDNSTDGQLYAHDVYQAAFPGLTRVLLRHCFFFENNGGLDSPALSDLLSLAESIIKLRAQAVDWRAKPASDSVIVRPIANEVVAPLKKIYAVFKRQAAHLQRVEDLQRAQEAAREAYQRQQERELLYEKQLSREHDQIRRLQELYLTRQEVETDRKRRVHLGLPQNLRLDLRGRPNIDANGSEFERINLFGPRSTLNAHHRPVELAPGAWTMEQRLDLMEGLEKFAESGRAFSKIIRRYCGPRGSLRDFKVHQLLEEAANLRQDLVRAEEENGKVVMPEFLQRLPDMDLLDYLGTRYS